MGLAFDEQALPDREVEDLDFEAAMTCFLEDAKKRRRPDEAGISGE